jgi:hypothetical protein
MNRASSQHTGSVSKEGAQRKERGKERQEDRTYGRMFGKSALEVSEEVRLESLVLDVIRLEHLRPEASHLFRLGRKGERLA